MIFRGLYDWCLKLAQHKHGERYLALFSAAESSFFPIPTDIMLAPLVMANRDRAWRLATITALSSVAGGLLGYLIGYFAFDMIGPWLESSAYWGLYQSANSWFEEWGFWALFAAGFLPIPYKLFTIAAGAWAVPLPIFIIASLIGRSARFFLVAAAVKYGGPYAEQHLLKYIDWIGWGIVIAGGAAWFLLR
jgi:membrane protein YqaA with SNARE-associated domain